LSNEIIKEVKEFLNNVDLSNYEISTYLTLLKANDLTAREISERSNVPTGRIYEVLESLKEKGMIEIQDSRPKLYRAFAFNQASNNVITHIKENHQKQFSFLIQQAKELESKIYTSGLSIKKNSSKIFWSTEYGAQSILSLYVKKLNILEKSLLMTGFLNENTIKVLPYGKDLYQGILNALERGIQVKYLWSFEFDDRLVSDDQKKKYIALYSDLGKRLKNLYNLSTKLKGFQMRFIFKRIPTYYDILDESRVLIKLQNPLNPSQIFACMNVLDPTLAKELANKYNNIWLFEATEKS
jgi:sugar-specific transcriptional regulator TrmB